MKYELIEIFWGWLARPILLWNLNDICTVVLEIIVIKTWFSTIKEMLKSRRRRIMNLKEAIKIHNELCNKEEIKKYCEALHIVCEKMQNCKPKKEYYKSSIINDYYIEHPYMELTISNGKAVYRRHKYSCSSESKDKKIKSNYCLSLCRYNREKIEKFIEKEIANDNLKVGGEE